MVGKGLCNPMSYNRDPGIPDRNFVRLPKIGFSHPPVENNSPQFADFYVGL